MRATKMIKGEGDEGLFGPGSMTWRVHAHPAMLIGGLRSLLVQALNPLTMAGVAQHSNYKDDSWGRLMRTTDYVMTTTYGDTAAAEHAVKIVQRIHDRVRGVDPVTGEAYEANDPKLLLWVHCAEVDAFIGAYRAYGPRISDADADRYVSEMAVLAELFDIPSADIPRNVAELHEYMESQELTSSAYARDAMKFILFPPVPWFGGKLPEIPGRKLLLIPGRAGWSLYSLATVAILPKRVRRAYGLPWVPMTPVLQAAVFAMSRTMRLVFAPPPPVLRAIERQRELESARSA
ncbi:MAG: DUF2236 domain-containing protein [Actinomycetota bacterium]|nr:DUF2236 domain-containing protein [Actinomycetota bacterium]